MSVSDLKNKSVDYKCVQRSEENHARLSSFLRGKYIYLREQGVTGSKC